MKEYLLAALLVIAVAGTACGGRYDDAAETAVDASAGQPAGTPADVPRTVDLAAWNRAGDDPWRFTHDGVAAGPAEATAFLVSPDTYADFRLSLEYRIEDDTNSGIYVRCTSAAEINPDTCYEINIWDNHPNQASRTGSIVKFVEPLVHVDGLDRWVPVEIVAQGERIVARFDGNVTAEIADPRSLSGPVALQYAGTGTLEFRNVSIERIQ